MGRTVLHDDRIIMKPQRLLAVLLLLVTVALAATDFEISLSSPPPEEVGPGEIVSVAIIVLNNSFEAISLRESLSLPEGWRSVFGTSTFEVAPDSFEIRIISFVVPNRALAGDYKAVYSVRDPEGRESEITINVRVASTLSLSLSRIEGPDYVQAGEDYSVVFSITNSSNIPVVIDLRADDNLSYRLSLSKSSLTLEPASTESVLVSAKTSSLLTDQSTHIITLTAKESSGSIRVTSARSSVVIIPPADSIANRFILLPARVTILAGFSDSLYLNSAIRIDGFIDDSKKRRINLEVSLPIIKATEEEKPFTISASYRSPYFEARYGNISRIGLASVSLGNSTSGLDLLIKLDPWKFGGSLSESFSEYDLFLDWRRSTDFAIGLALDGNLSLSGQHILSVAAESRIDQFRNRSVLRVPSLDGKLDGLLFSSDFTNRVEHWQLRSSIDYSNRISEGSDREILKLSGGVIWQEPGSLRLSLEGNIRRNTPFDFQLPGLLDSFSLQARASSPSLSGLYLSIGGNYGAGSVRSSGGQITYFGTNLSASYSYSMISAFASFALQYSGIPSDYKGTHSLELYGSYRFSNLTYVYARTSLKYYVGDRCETALSLVVTHITGGGMKLNTVLTYEMRDLQPSKIKGEFLSSATLPGGSSIGIGFNVGASLKDYWKPSISFSLSYTFPFSLPVSPRSNLTSLSGEVSILVGGEQVPVKGAVVTLNNLVSICDENGRFKFGGLRPGKYYLDIDARSLERGLISVKTVPFEIELKENEEDFVSLYLTRSATLRVRLIKPEQTEISLGGVLIILSNGEVYRLTTRESGEIVVPNLKPGKLTVRIDTSTLPNGVAVESQLMEIDLKPGATETIEIQLREKEESIIIIDTGVL